MWSDNRNHLLDDVIHDTIIVVVAQLIGVAPGQFIAVVALTQLSESLQHANLRVGLRRDRRAFVDQPALSQAPSQHRHRARVGRALDARRPQLRRACCRCGTCLFRTGNFEDRYDPTGIRDQVEAEPGRPPRDYGRGFWAQQWFGLKRMVGRG